MKLESSHSRLPVEWQSYLCRIFPSDSFDSTISIESHDRNKDPAHSNDKRRCRVRFTAAKDEIITPTTTTTTTNNKYHSDINLVKELWYSRRQVDYFRAEARVLARAWVAADNPQEETWVQGLYRAYWMFSKNNNDDDNDNEEQNDQACPVTMTVPVVDSAVGLERRVIMNTGAGRDRNVRRQQLLARLHMIAQTVEDAEQQEYLVAQAAQANSRPARLYAAFLAQWWWQHGSDHDEKSKGE